MLFLVFPRQVLNPTKSVVAGYHGVNCLKQSPRVSFDLHAGTVHGNECRAIVRLRQVLIRVSLVGPQQLRQPSHRESPIIRFSPDTEITSSSPQPACRSLSCARSAWARFGKTASG